MGKIKSLLILLCAATTLLCVLPMASFAKNSNYLNAIELNKEEKFKEAIPQFRTAVEEFEDDPVYGVRSKVWYAFALLEQDAESKDAATILFDVACETLSESERAVLKESGSPTCPQLASTYQASSQLDVDMITATISALGTLQWRNKNYAFSLSLLTLASQRLSNETSAQSNTSMLANQLANTQTNSVDEMLSNSQQQQEVLRQQIMERVMSGGLSNGEGLVDNQSIQQMVQAIQVEKMAEIQKQASAGILNQEQNAGVNNLKSLFEQRARQTMVTSIVNFTCQNSDAGKVLAKQQADRLEGKQNDELRQTFLNIAAEGISDCSEDALARNWGIAKELSPSEIKAAKGAEREKKKQDKRLARLATREGSRFYSLADRAMCQYIDPPQVNSMAGVEGVTRSALARFVEVSRGQVFESFKMTELKVLNALNQFLDSTEGLRAKVEQFSVFDRQRKRFIGELAYCADALNLDSNFNQSFMTLLTKDLNKRFSEKHILTLLDTKKRLSEVGKFSDPMQGVQDANSSWILGEFYYRKNQPQKALPELRSAFDAYEVDSRMSMFPEYGYLAIIQSAKALRAITDSLVKTDGDSREVSAKLDELKKRADRFRNRVLGGPEEPGQMSNAEALSTSKQALNQAFDSKQVKDALAQAQQMAAQFGAADSEHDPFDRLQEFQELINSGDMDEEMTSSIGRISELIQNQSPIQQADVFGTSLERKYHLHNNHSITLLLLAQIAQQTNNKALADSYLKEAKAYIESNHYWMAPRVKGYLGFLEAHNLIASGEQDKAFETLQLAVEAWYFQPHSMIDIFLSPLNSTTDILEAAIDLAVARKQFQQALTFIEIARDADWESDALYGMHPESKLKQLDEQLQSRLNELKNIARDRARSRGDLDDFEVASRQGEAAAARSDRDQLSRALLFLSDMKFWSQWLEPELAAGYVVQVMEQSKRRQAFRFRHSRSSVLAEEAGSDTSIQLKRIGRSLDDYQGIAQVAMENVPADTLMLSMWMGLDSSYVIAIDSGELRAHALSSKELSHQIRQFNRRDYRAQEGKLLYDSLMSPYLKRYFKRLLIVSNGTLQGVPAAAFSLKEDHQDWLGDHYIIRTMPRIRTLLNTNAANSNNDMLVLDASNVPGEDRLKYAESEIAAIKKYFNSKTVASEQLKKELAVDLIPQYPLVHFLGHSQLNNNIPDYSSMSLYEDKLYLAELRQLELENVELFVLGSCESAAKQNEVYGDEFSTLQDGLHEAGARSVIATLFKVDDKISVVLLSHFYQSLADGMKKDEALQRAQRVARQYALDQGYESNKDWAAFVLSGSNTAL